MRLKLTLVGLVAGFLLLAGMRPDAVPFLRSAARYSDSVTAHWPNALFLQESVLERGEFPVWRETTMGGQPFAANPLNKTSYPLQWLALLFPPSLHLNILIVLHLFLAGSGMWVWARSLGLRTEAIALSTVTYVMAPRLIGHVGAGHLDVLYALAWWPWLMWAIRQSVIQQEHWLKISLQLGLIGASLLLADVRVSLFAFVSGVVYGIVVFILPGNRRQLRYFALLLPIMFVLTSALLVPLVMWQSYITRGNITSNDAGLFSLETVHLLGLILPSQPPGIETLTYLGLPVLTLGMAAIFISDRFKVLLLMVVVGVFLYALGTNSLLWNTLMKAIPGLLWFRVPARAWLILVLLLPLLAGYGLQWLLNWVEDQSLVIVPRVKLGVVAWMAITVIMGIFALLVLRLPVVMGLATLVIGLVLGAILLLAFDRRINSRQVFVFMLALVFADLAWTGYQWITWRGPEIWLDGQRTLAERLVEAQADRIYSPTYSLEQQVVEVYHLRLFGGVDPFQLTGIVKAVEQGSGVPSTKYDPVLPSLMGVRSDGDVVRANQNAIIDTVVLAQWHVSHVVAAYPIEHSRLELLDHINDVYIYTNRDYQSRTENINIPDWPVGWPSLPDRETVQNFNQITMLTYLISGVAWVISIGAFIFLKFKPHA
ncbi:MAG: hypothetical protein K8L97_34460 [Anaerolineae bacterium]|nr:hypothetical protein [Anaerolineae bacterium]